MEQEIFGGFNISKIADSVGLTDFNVSGTGGWVRQDSSSTSFPPIDTVVGTITYPRFTTTLYIWKENDFTLISLSKPVYNHRIGRYEGDPIITMPKTSLWEALIIFKGYLVNNDALVIIESGEIPKIEYGSIAVVYKPLSEKDIKVVEEILDIKPKRRR